MDQPYPSTTCSVSNSGNVITDGYGQAHYHHPHHHHHSSMGEPLVEVTNNNLRHPKVEEIHPSHQHQLSVGVSHDQLAYNPIPDPIYHPPPIRLNLTHQAHQAHQAHQNRNEIGYSPSTFPGSSSELCASSDRAHSPSNNWSHPHHLPHHDSLQLRHRSISLSTPTSTHSSGPSDHGPSHPIARILTMPSYPLESPDHLRSAPQTLDIRPLQMNLPELDPRYHLHSSLDQPARLGSTPTSRKPPPPVLASAYEPYTPTDYHTSGVSSATFPSTYDFNPRLPSSPSTNLYRQLPPRHFASPVSAGLGPSCPEPVIGQKRRHLVSAPEHDYSPQRKRQAVSNPSPQLVHIPHAKESGHQRMTTVLCLHASVAQKSYGQEKRFLCPPPLVRITGPYRHLPQRNRPVLSMSILNEDGDQHLSQSAYLGEDESNVHFKSLHISGAAKKAKHVTLELSLHPPTASQSQTLHSMGPDLKELSAPFATFTSEDCNIISKPSKKTAKARNTQSCIFNGSTICLFNRINSQTVRTKYLCVEQDQLAARASQWSAFTINVVRRAEDAGIDGSPSWATKTLLSSSIPGASRTVTYGSEVELIDFVTGVSSGPLVVRKVEKNKVQKDATGPISQMQKLAFCKVDRDGHAIYISALEPGRFPSPSDLGSPFDMGGDVHGLSFGPPQASPATFHSLQYQTPRAVLPPEEQGGMTLDEIDDSVAWTVIGVSHFSHTFFDLSPHYPQIPQEPVTPLPTIVGPPQIDLEALTLTMTLNGFFDQQARPMEVWIGPIGPLSVNVLSTTGITLASDEGSSGVRLQVTGDDVNSGWRKQQETHLVASLPTLDTMHVTLHGTPMPAHAVVMLDESHRSISELMGRRRGGPSNDARANAIPTLPITLIRTDGMSFVMAHSVCLADVDRGEEGLHHAGEWPLAEGVDQDLKDPSRNQVCILKVI